MILSLADVRSALACLLMTRSSPERTVLHPSAPVSYTHLFSLVHARLTDEELVKVVQAISEILKPLERNEPASGRKMRTLGLIVSPPDSEA